MSSCNISNKLKFLSTEKLKQLTNEQLVDIIVDNSNTGFYYDTNEIVNFLEKRFGEEFSPQSFVNYFEGRINNMKVFSEHPFFSQDLNVLFNNAPTQLNYLNQSFETDLVKLTFIDPNATDNTKLTLNDSQLNEKIQNYKNKLLKNLYDFLVETYPNFEENEFKPLYINGKFQYDNSYSLVLNKIAEIYKNFDPDISIYKPEKVAKLDIYNSAIILSNFDKLVENNFKSLLTINQKNVGALTNPVDTFHYFLEFKGAYTEYWTKDSHEASSIENYSSTILKTLAKTIPLYDASGNKMPGQYLGMDRLYYIGSIIKNLNKKSGINFQDNPKKYLKQFLSELKSDKKIEYLGSLHSLYNYLYSYNSNVSGIINKAKVLNPNIANQIIDVEALIAHSINNMSPLIYSKYVVNEDKTILDMVERETKSDEILDFISRNIISNNSPLSGYTISTKPSESGFTGTILFKDSPVNANIFISSITGLSINDSIIKAYNETSSALRIPIEQVFHKIYEKAIYIKRNNITDPKDVRKILSSDADINSLVSAIISSSLPSAVMNFVDSKGNKVPTIGQSNLASEIKTSLEIAKNKLKESSKNYFILNNEGLIKNSEILLEVEKGNTSKSAIELNPAENFSLNFIENYIKPMWKPFSEIEKENIPLSFKLINFSDKSRIYNLAIDQNFKVKENGKSLKEMSNDEVKELSKKSLNNYYSQLEKSILNDWGKLVDSKGNKIFSKTPTSTEVNKYLEESKVNLKSLIYNTWKYYNKLGETFEFVEDVHYSKYSDGLRFNNTIREYLNKSSESGDINQVFEENFIKKMGEIGAVIPLQNILEPNSPTLTIDRIKENIQNLKKELNVDLTDWVQNNKLILYKIKTNKTYENVTEAKPFKENKSYELNPLIAKWLHSQNLIRFGYLGVTVAHEYQHPHKLGLSSDNKDFVREITGRATSMTKRMVIIPATQEYFMRGLPESPPEVAKIAIVDDTPAPVWNYTGVSKNIDAMDGAIQGTPFFTYLLKHSMPGKEPKNTQKVIGHSFNGQYSTFLKCALFTMTNETIRKSMLSDLSHDVWMKKTHNIDISDIDISKQPNGNFIDFGDLSSNVYYKINGNYNRIKSLEKINDNTYKMVYGITQGKGNEQIESKEVKINNLYDVWQLFGGAYSLENKNGKYSFSEGSIEAVGKLITLIPELKDRMIHIIAQKSAVKNGAFNINSSESLRFDSNKDLMWGEFDTHFFGVQLDAYHTSDEAMINEVSQVIAALAENQSTPEFYRDLYQAIGKIVGKEIEEYEKKYKINGQYNIPKITDTFVKELLSKDQIGNANEIINSLKKNGVNIIPFSNSNFFNQFVISVMSKLKSDFVKRKYPGIACVLNPSYGSIQLFEDNLGNTYFAEDLLKFAESQDIPTEYSNINDYHKKVLDSVVTRKFPNTSIKADQINPLDRILVNGVELNLNDLKLYYLVKSSLENNVLPDLPEFVGIDTNNIQIEKINNKSRDLKPVEITFITNKTSKNAFDLDAVKLLWGLKNNTLSDSDKTILNNFAKYFKLEGYDSSDYFKSKLNAWVQRSFEMLDNGVTYLSVTAETDFNEYFNGDSLTENLTQEYMKNTSPIENYIHKAAEVILPKRYRNEFSLGSDSFNTIMLGKDGYFRSKLNKEFTPKTKDCDLYLFSSKGQSLYISVLSDINQIEGYKEVPIITKNIDGNLYRVDIKGEKLYKLPTYKTKEGETHAKIYEKNGVEYIMFENRPGVFDNVKNFINSSEGKFDIIYPFGSNIITKEEFNELWQISKNYSKGSVYRDLLRQVNLIQDSDNYLNVLSSLSGINYEGITLSEYFIENFNALKNKLVSQLAKSTYTSWDKSNQISAARIPSQAMQSFMSMTNKGYIEDEGNDVYVSHIQLFLQGSDLDIDKAYMMMHGFKNSIYEGWSPFFSYNSPKELKLSEKLPIPNGLAYEFSDDLNNSIDIKPFVEGLSKSKYLPLNELVFLLNLVKSNNKIYYNPINDSEKASYDRLLKLINKHNGFNYSSDSLKNFVVKNIIETSNSPKNQVSSYSPINNDKYTQIKKKIDIGTTLMIGDGISMDQQQENNAIGKDVIGIAANGIKVYFSLVDYFTDYYTGEINNIDNKYFEREFTIEFTKNPVNKKITNKKSVKVNRIAGLKLNKQAIDILNNKIVSIITSPEVSKETQEEIKELGKEYDLYNLFDSNRDPSLVLSSLLSSATDNAKELILKAINAGTEFASMHVYLITLGFDEGKVAQFMIGDDATNILKGLNYNIFTDTTRQKTVDELIEDKKISYEFKKIYNLAKELTFIAKVLKINQGLRADSYDIYKYFKDIEDEFISRQKQFIKDTNIVKASGEQNLLQLFRMRVLQDKPYLGKDMPYVMKSIINAVDVGILSEKYEPQDFSLDKFFSDPEYRQIATNYYNLIKGTFNVLDIMTNLDHYWNVIVASKMVYDQIKEVSSKFEWVTNELPSILNEAKSQENIRSTEGNFNIEGTKKDNYNKDQLKSALATFDDLVISSFISSELGLTPIDLHKVSVDLKQPVVKFDKGVSREAKSGDFITFDSSESLLDFKNLIEKTVIPYLKKSDLDNPLINSLVTRTSSWDRNRTWLTTKISMGKVTNPENGQVLYEYQKGMDSLSNEKIKLGDVEFRIDDLLFLYNLIVNKDKPGSDRLTKLFGKYINKNNSFASRFYQYYTQIDEDLNNLFKDKTLTNDDKKWIMFSVLNKHGVLRRNNSPESSDIRLYNSNLPMAVNSKSVYNNPLKMKQLQDILNLIGDKKLLIDFNCG